MGYTTDFEGAFKFKKAPTKEQIEYINTFSDSRRMRRDPLLLKMTYNGLHGLNGLYGNDGEFFAIDDGNYGQSNRIGVNDFNTALTSTSNL